MKVVIVGDASSAKRAMHEIEGSSKSMAGKVGGAFASIAKAGAFAAGAAGIGGSTTRRILSGWETAGAARSGATGAAGRNARATWVDPRYAGHQ